MSSLNFTPWKIKPSTQHIGKVYILDSRGFTFSHCGDVGDFCTEKEQDDEAKQIAMLMAAAPELLQALQDLLVLYQRKRPGLWGASLDQVKAARAAIQKATGAV